MPQHNNSTFTKRFIARRIFKAFLIYIALILTASILASFVGGALFVVVFGVVGQFCFFGSCTPLFLIFPFAPVLILNGVIFIIVDIFSRDSIIARHKIRFALIILGVIIFFLGGIFIVRPFIRRTISDMKSESRLRDAEYYKSEYLETGEPTSSQQFIYARDNRIMVSGMNGENPRLIKEIPLEETKKIFSVSPKGTYYIAASKNDDEVYNSGVKKDVVPIAEVRAVSDNAFVMSITSPELLQDELKLCKWSFDEQFVACRYYEDAHGRKQLMLFDIMRGNATHIYDDPSLGGTRENFTWSDENLDIFYDHYDHDDQTEKIYRIDNIKEMSESGFTVQPHRVLLNNLAPCFGAGAYQNGTIYCVTTTKELPGYKALPKNEFLSIKDGLIIAYRAPDKNERDSRIVATKAPFSFSAGFDDIALYPVNTNYIAVYGADYGFFLLNLQTGKINPFQTFTIHENDLVFPEYIKTTNIFKNISSGTVPVPYRGVQ